jgi:hypothetical protein
MNTALVIAVIALVGSILTAALSLYGQFHTANGRSAKQRRCWRSTASCWSERRSNCGDACTTSSSRPAEALRQRGRRADVRPREYAHVVAQYLAGARSSGAIQLLAFRFERTRSAARSQSRIVELFQSDDPALGRSFMLWRGEQRRSAS